MKEVFNYSIVYYFSPGYGGYSTTSGNCVFKRESDAREDMEKKINNLKSQEERYGRLKINSSRVYSIEVK